MVNSAVKEIKEFLLRVLIVECNKLYVISWVIVKCNKVMDNTKEI